MPMEIYLGIDIGTSSAKCIAFDAAGKMLCSSQHSYGMDTSVESFCEQNPDDYLIAFTEVVCSTVNKLKLHKIDLSDIKSIALSTQADTLIVTDPVGNPKMPAVSWMDTRAKGEYEELLAMHDQTFWQNELGQVLTPYNSICAIKWLQKHRPEELAKDTRLSYVPDWMAYKLTGNWVADMPSASWSPYCSPSTRDISSKILDILGLDRKSFCDIVESGEVIGTVTEGFCRDTGLPCNVPLVAGAFDQSAAAHGAGASANGRSVLSCGTAWVLYTVSEKPISCDSPSLCTCCHIESNQWGTVMPFSGGAAYDWLHKLFDREHTQKVTNNEPLVFIPHLYGGLSPDWNSSSKGSVLGLTLSHSFEDVELAIMRGMACEARRNLDESENYCGKIEAVRMVGGAGKSELWVQMIADILARPVEVLDNTESACYGAAKIAAEKVSADWPDGNVKVVAPDASRSAVEQDYYAHYLDCYQKVSECYR